MRQQHDDLRALLAHLVNRGLQVLLLDTVRPIRHEVTRVGNGTVGESLPDDGDGNTVHLFHDVGLEHGITEVGGFDILRDHIHLAAQHALFRFFDALCTIHTLEVHGHHIHAQFKAGVDHVLAVAPQSLTATLPSVTAIQQQCTGARCAHLFDQRRQMRKATHLAIAFCGLDEI